MGIGDGKIFVTDLQDSIRIRTGETGAKTRFSSLSFDSRRRTSSRIDGLASGVTSDRGGAGKA